jgi:hypothetical protein
MSIGKGSMKKKYQRVVFREKKGLRDTELKWFSGYSETGGRKGGTPREQEGGVAKKV